MVTKPDSKAAAPTAHPGSEHDIIEDMLSLVVSMAPGFTAELAKRADKQIRDKWAGDRPYIAKRSGEGSSQRNSQIKADYLKGERIALLERRYKISRARIWQIIKS